MQRRQDGHSQYTAAYLIAICFWPGRQEVGSGPPGVRQLTVNTPELNSVDRRWPEYGMVAGDFVAYNVGVRIAFKEIARPAKVAAPLGSWKRCRPSLFYDQASMDCAGMIPE